MNNLLTMENNKSCEVKDKVYFDETQIYMQKNNITAFSHCTVLALFLAISICPCFSAYADSGDSPLVAVWC